MNLKEKKVLVCGFGKTGLAAVNFLLKADESVLVTVYTENEVETIESFDEDRVNYFVAKNPNDIISKYDLIVVSPGISTSERFFEIAREQNIEVISEIELANRYFKGILVAITGTNGKCERRRKRRPQMENVKDAEDEDLKWKTCSQYPN